VAGKKKHRTFIFLIYFFKKFERIMPYFDNIRSW
jgi:hypothetical protein